MISKSELLGELLELIDDMQRSDSEGFCAIMYGEARGFIKAMRCMDIIAFDETTTLKDRARAAYDERKAQDNERLQARL